MKKKKQLNIAMETIQETDGSAVEQSVAYSHYHTTVRPITAAADTRLFIQWYMMSVLWTDEIA